MTNSAEGLVKDRVAGGGQGQASGGCWPGPPGPCGSPAYTPPWPTHKGPDGPAVRPDAGVRTRPRLGAGRPHGCVPGQRLAQGLLGGGEPEPGSPEPAGGSGSRGKAGPHPARPLHPDLQMALSPPGGLWDPHAPASDSPVSVGPRPPYCFFLALRRSSHVVGVQNPSPTRKHAIGGTCAEHGQALRAVALCRSLGNSMLPPRNPGVRRREPGGEGDAEVAMGSPKLCSEPHRQWG